MTDPRETMRAAIARLVEKQPYLHGRDELAQHSIGRDVLAWLAGTLTPDMVTLETGCGWTTVVFAASGCKHTAISPVIQEHERVRTWLRQEKIPTEGLELIVRESHEILPRFRVDPLDVVVIDGSAAFPHPFLDWFYTAQRLKAGGYVIIEDTQLRTGFTLCEFLAEEEGRWRLIEQFNNAVVFQKLVEEVLAVSWHDQPWAARKQKSLSARKAWQELRKRFKR